MSCHIATHRKKLQNHFEKCARTSRWNIDVFVTYKPAYWTTFSVRPRMAVADKRGHESNKNHITVFLKNILLNVFVISYFNVSISQCKKNKKINTPPTTPPPPPTTTTNNNNLKLIFFRNLCLKRGWTSILVGRYGTLWPVSGLPSHTCHIPTSVYNSNDTG